MILCWKTSKCLNQLGRGEEVDCPICCQPCHLADRQSFELRKGTMSWTVTAHHCHDTLLQLTQSPIQTGLTARRGDRVELLSCSHVRVSTWFGGVAEKLRVRNPKLKDQKTLNLWCKKCQFWREQSDDKRPCFWCMSDSLNIWLLQMCFVHV